MPVIQITDTKVIAPLFANWPETMIWSCLQGCMGAAYVEEGPHPAAARIMAGDISFFAGVPCEALITGLPKGARQGFHILVPKDAAWGRAIEAAYGGKAVKRMRYATKKEPDTFERQKLEGYVLRLPAAYRLRRIEEELYNQIRATDWAQDLCANFTNYTEYAKLGLGIAALEEGTIVAGASSYTAYREGIEIEIDTREDKRRQGLALACGAKLILECLDKGLYPSWDAHNKGSLALAQKLGYTFDKEYPAYEVFD